MHLCVLIWMHAAACNDIHNLSTWVLQGKVHPDECLLCLQVLS